MARILIVEDEPQQLELRRVLLERAGHEVVAAPNLADAKKHLADRTPQVVVMDLRLPKLSDGRELIRSVAAHPSRPKILVLSGWSDDLYDLPETPMVDRVLDKPVTTPQLLETVAELAGRASGTS
jgi:CheY-like chemotaxis protein